MANRFITTVIKNKCPNCGEGDVFESSNPYNLKKLTKMNSHCSACDFKYEREVGFFFGAMYVSYGINAAVFIALFLGLELFGPEDLNVFVEIGIISGTMIALVPITFQWSRKLWMVLFGK